MAIRRLPENARIVLAPPRYAILHATMSPIARFVELHWVPLIVAVGLISISLLLIYLFAREILTQLLEQLKGIVKLCGHFFGEIGKFLFQLVSILWIIWGLFFALRWRTQSAIRSFFVSTTFGVLILGTIYLCIELGMTLISGLRSELPALYERLKLAIHSKAPTLYAVLPKFKLQRLPEIPFVIECVLFVLAVLMFRHHWHEFKASRRREAVPPAFEELTLELDRFRKEHPTPDKSQKCAFFEILMTKMKQVFDTKSRRDVAFSIMDEEETDDGAGNKKRTGILKIYFLPNGSPLDKELRLLIGQGGAGKAYGKKAAIYIPSVRHLIGLNLKTRRSEGVTYVEGASLKTKPRKEKLRSILSVPVLADSKKDVVAILTVSSRKRNAFSEEDFDIASLAAAIVSTVY
jgi:hypothetical protein